MAVGAIGAQVRLGVGEGICEARTLRLRLEQRGANSKESWGWGAGKMGRPCARDLCQGRKEAVEE